VSCVRSKQASCLYDGVAITDDDQFVFNKESIMLALPIKFVLVLILVLQGRSSWFGNDCFPGLFSTNALVSVQLEWGGGCAPAWGPYNCMRDHHELLSIADLFNAILGRKL
jgi:hypothetical protein